MNYTDNELAHLQAAALYTFDANGHLLAINEPEPEAPAPRFFLSCTKQGNLWFTRYDLPAALAANLAQLAADEPINKSLNEPPRHANEYRALLAAHAPIDDIYAGPAYYLPELEPAADTVMITTANASLLETHYPYTFSHLAERAPIVVMVQDGVAVACCFAARITSQVAEAGVYTVEEYRGRGYAAQIVRGWANAVRASNRLPLYSTAWENTASQAVAAKLGAIQYAATLSIT